MFPYQDKHPVKRSKKSGFSLIEAMLAMAIFVIGILGVYALQLHATQGNTLANRVSTSANWASYTIEEVLAQRYEDLPVGSPDDDADGDPDLSLERMDGTADGIIFVQPDGSIIRGGEPGAPGNPLYTVYYNIAAGDAAGKNDEKVLKGVKLIRTHVVRSGGVSDVHLYSQTYYKTVWPE